MDRFSVSVFPAIGTSCLQWGGSSLLCIWLLHLPLPHLKHVGQQGPELGCPEMKVSGTFLHKDCHAERRNVLLLVRLASLVYEEAGNFMFEFLSALSFPFSS